MEVMDLFLLADQVVGSCFQLQHVIDNRNCEASSSNKSRQTKYCATVRSITRQIASVVSEVAEVSEKTKILQANTSEIRFKTRTVTQALDVLQSQLGIQLEIIESNALRCFDVNLIPFLQLSTFVRCSVSCSSWRKKYSSFWALGLPYWQLSSTISLNPPPVHHKFNVSVSQLDLSSFICGIESKRCLCESAESPEEINPRSPTSQMLSSTMTRNGSDISFSLSICERHHTSQYDRELEFAKAVVSIDNCIKDVNEDIQLRSRAFLSLCEKEKMLTLKIAKAETKIASRGKALLDLKTQFASDAHTTMFLEKEFSSITEQLKCEAGTDSILLQELEDLQSNNHWRRSQQSSKQDILQQEISALQRKIALH
uniref:Uncharacterized protein n=1 Tax=Spongospora subterranea TaxID=70186 RepID=A0A0H5R958_9EUKA|eukprot:CRZ10286.1 hypothetical protein [Spongospora subterranea]